MNPALGAMKWLIPDCFYPPTDSPGQYVSHEAICVLNTGVREARLRLTLYFEDQEPRRFRSARCAGERTAHIRLDRLRDGAGRGIPRGVPYALLVESDVPVVVQYSRLDTAQAELALMTAMAHPI